MLGEIISICLKNGKGGVVLLGGFKMKTLFTNFLVALLHTVCQQLLKEVIWYTPTTWTKLLCALEISVIEYCRVHLCIGIG